MIIFFLFLFVRFYIFLVQFSIASSSVIYIYFLSASWLIYFFIFYFLKKLLPNFSFDLILCSTPTSTCFFSFCLYVSLPRPDLRKVQTISLLTFPRTTFFPLNTQKARFEKLLYSTGIIRKIPLFNHVVCLIFNTCRLLLPLVTRLPLTIN